MVKVVAPMMSLGASGKLGDAVVFSVWKGRPYVRTLVTPANPKSGGQVGMRAMLKFLSQDWTNVIAGSQNTWQTRADNGAYSKFNAYTSYNQKRWRNFTAPTSLYPEATDDTAAVHGTLAAVAGERSITVTQPVTTANDGWGVAFFRALTSSMTSAWDNLVAVVPVDSTNDVIFVDTPLTADTYYYVVRGISLDGQLAAQGSEVNAVVT